MPDDAKTIYYLRYIDESLGQNETPAPCPPTTPRLISSTHGADSPALPRRRRRRRRRACSLSSQPSPTLHSRYSPAVAEGDRIANLPALSRAPTSGEFMGMPATGKRIDITSFRHHPTCR